MPDAEILPLGLDGLLVRFSDKLSDEANRAALAFESKVREVEAPGVVETATSLTSVLVRFDPCVTRREAMEDQMGELLDDRDWLKAPLPSGRKLWRIPTVFGGTHGPQLEEAADLAGRTAEQAIEEIAASRLRVLALGFAPGQPYLGFLDAHWDIPRQTEVTPRVPAGAVVVAVRQLIPFANAAPTGWRQIGQTAFRCYDRDGEPAIPLSAGDDVQFAPVTADEFERLENSGPLGGAVSEPIG